MHPSPVPYADVVTTTVHKTLGGPRSGLILCREEYAKKINSAVFPGQQGGPLEHAIAAKAVAFKIAASDLFKERQERTVAGAKALAEELLTAGAGVNVLTGGTDVHLVLVDLRESELDGQQAEDRLHSIGITVNRNAVPFDPRPPMVTSGLRIGTPALATRGLQVDDFHEVGKIIARALQPGFEDAQAGADASASRRSSTASRSTRTWAPPPRCRDYAHGAVAVSGSDEHERDALARLTLLARVGEILGSGLRRQETLDRVAELLVPGLAAWCAIDVADVEGVLAQPRRPCPATFPLAPDAPHGPAIVMRTGEPELVARRRALSPPRARCCACAAALAARADTLGRAADAAARPTSATAPFERRAGARDRPPDRDRDRGPALRRALPDAVRGQPDADVGLRRRDARLPGRQRRRDPPLRLLARGVPGDADHATSARPRTSRRCCADVEARGGAGLADARRSGATCARTAR